MLQQSVLVATELCLVALERGCGDDAFRAASGQLPDAIFLVNERDDQLPPVRQHRGRHLECLDQVRRFIGIG
ncbi:hypothetical protein [Nocardioides speluncae]|uniref:hypothetical protein n=1 Tax=Nocardioides speluncae TaxID=2670337 RepID=UPI000D68B234|nr:hypothetical protein [Nocardioides speluncae]